MARRPKRGGWSGTSRALTSADRTKLTMTTALERQHAKHDRALAAPAGINYQSERSLSLPRSAIRNRPRGVAPGHGGRLVSAGADSAPV